MYQTKLPGDEYRIRIPKSQKPRVKELNDLLISLGGGRMKSPKDYNRSRDKHELRHLIEESE